MAGRHVAVAWSGGRDSTALLHATLVEASSIGVKVLALHVHHGLSAHADDWLAHCASQARRWARQGKPIEFVAHRLSGSPAAGDSVEAWARRERYRALRAMALARGAAVVLLAHHQRDQAETFLLQALRGAGPAGLSGMPRSILRDGIEWKRPWLDRTRDAIDAYVRKHRLKHIEDDTNDDERFARNRLRKQVWPALIAAFAQAESTLAATAQWAQEANAALGELADTDLASVASDRGLVVRAWLALSLARRSNALRAWLKRDSGAAPPASLVMRLLDELPLARHARWPVDGGELRLYRGVLTCAGAATDTSSPRERVISVTRVGEFILPGWGGSLHVDSVTDAGVPLVWLARLDLRERQGGEQFQAGIGRPPRSLKKQFQAAAVSTWEREGPLLYSGGQLVYVPGLGLDARIIGLPGQQMVTLRWVPAKPPQHAS